MPATENPSRPRAISRLARPLAGALSLLALAAGASAGPSDPWETPFNADAAAIRKAADLLPAAEGADAEILLKEGSYVLDESGRSTMRVRTVIRVLAPAGVESWAQFERQWAPWYQDRPLLRARVIGKDGIAHELDSRTVAEGPAGDESLEIYSDRRVVRAPLPSLAPGSLIEEEFEIHEREIEFEAGSVHGFGLTTTWPVRRVRVTVEAPASRQIKARVRGLPAADVRQEQKGEVVRFAYEGGPFPAFEGWEVGTPVEDIRQARFTFSTGRSWQEVAARYAAIVDGRIASGPVAAPAAKSAGAPDSRAGWAGLAARAHRLVRYTGVEFGEAAIVPSPPAETSKRGFGDCKDKAVLLVAMLRAQGIPAHVALLWAGGGPDVDPALPGLGEAFNHAIVVVEGKERIWIDATDEYGTPGTLPEADQGRLALIADAATRDLVRTPLPQAADNGLIETREFFLSERGPARVVETTEPLGADERDYRRTYDRTQRKDLEKRLERYAASIYLAKNIGRLEYSDPLDFSSRFRMRLEIPEATRGLTDENEAVVALLPSEWAGALPGVLQQPAAESEPAEVGKEEKPGRKHDFVWERPFTREWRYRVVPHDGFAPAGLPESGTRSLGTVSLSQEYTPQKDGSVLATIRLTSGKTRISPAEVEAVRAEAGKLSREAPVLIRLESLGAKHLAAGRIREALTEYRRLAALHPKEALHHVQIANALLRAGLGEAARRQALIAIQIEKDSALAQRALGWALQHDLLGRRFGRGFDRSGAVAAYRRSIELESDEEDGRANLAILLEHDLNGERYGDPAQVREAVAEYQELKRALKSKTYDINLLIALFRSEQYAEARKMALEMPQEPQRNQLLLAAIAASEGPEAALKEAGRFSTDPEPRRQAIENAGRLLILVRSYGPAARLLSEAAQGAMKPGALLTQAEALRKMHRYEETKLPPDDPATVVRRLNISLFLHGRPGVAPVIPLFTRSEREASAGKTEDELVRGFRSAIGSPAAGVPPTVVLDASFSMMTLSSEGSEAVGYRVYAGGSPQTENMVFFVRREEGEYRIVAPITFPPALGAEALSRANAGDLAGARQWLDWARDGISAGGGNDPLGGPLLPRFWTKGSTAGPARIRLAAAALACGAPASAAAARAVLEEPVPPEEKDLKEEDLELARAACDVTLKKNEELRAGAERLLEKHPDSAQAFRLMQIALGGLRKWEEAEKLASGRLKRLPDDPLGLEYLSSARMEREDYKGVEEACLALVARGKASRMIYNNLAWTSLFTGGATEKAIEYAQQAAGTEGSRDPAALHTLATLYAELGRSVQAREALLESLERRGRDEPQAHDWYVLGRIAENYGELETARDDYSRVTPPDNGRLGGSTHLLAQKRLAELARTSPPAK